MGKHWLGPKKNKRPPDYGATSLKILGVKRFLNKGLHGEA